MSPLCQECSENDIQREKLVENALHAHNTDPLAVSINSVRRLSRTPSSPAILPLSASAARPLSASSAFPPYIDNPFSDVLLPYLAQIRS